VRGTGSGGTGGSGGYAGDGGAGDPGYGPGSYGGYQFPNTNRSACAASPGEAPLGGGFAGVAFAAVVAALRRRRRTG
jgi:MYXO-CTERM domain-containing protein